MDLGSYGIMTPMVHNEKQAEFIVESSKYPPIGLISMSKVFPRFVELAGVSSELQDQ